ncbi:MAG: polysaccharide pyruvyl transferase family protein [bacterium]|nr:polysaccharide pyruvyl transferase family protein [bacterium]
MDTGNRGVSALGLSTLKGILQFTPNAHLTLFDHGSGVREEEIALGDRSARVRFVGCTYSRRYYKPSNLNQMLFAAQLGLKGIHPMLRLLDDLDLVLSMSGGDSFSDIYGDWRFRAVTTPALVALQMGRPLVLLPQTYGPYEGAGARQTASSILQEAQSVWARDAHSLTVATEVAGAGHDPSRFHLGVDVAFGLPARVPSNATLREELEALRRRFDCVVGLNVSGLLYNVPGKDQSHYGMKSQYRATIHALIESLMERAGVGVVLLPHVTASGRDTVDCDAAACLAIRDRLPANQRERFVFCPDDLGPMEAKWVVSQLDWFCGTRMHSCIAGISQGIPTTAIAYSDKTLGVFETVGVGDCVVDPRKLDGDEIVRQTMAGLDARERAARELEEGLPAVKRRLDEQFQNILGIVQ